MSRPACKSTGTGYPEITFFTLALFYYNNSLGNAHPGEFVICLLYTSINRTVYEQHHPLTRKAQLSLYEQLCFYIDEHLSEDLSLERLAAELFVSKYHIAHVFKDEIGMSIHQYISKKRLARCV